MNGSVHTGQNGTAIIPLWNRSHASKGPLHRRLGRSSTRLVTLLPQVFSNEHGTGKSLPLDWIPRPHGALALAHLEIAAALEEEVCKPQPRGCLHSLKLQHRCTQKRKPRS